MRILFFNLSICMIIFFSCTKNPVHPIIQPTQNCGASVVIDSVKFMNPTSANFSIDTLYINGDCLHITINASGCDGSTWDLQMIDAGQVIMANPPARYERFVFTNNETCLAVFSKTYSFDLKALRINNSSILDLYFPDLFMAYSYNY